MHFKSSLINECSQSLQVTLCGYVWMESSDGLINASHQPSAIAKQHGQPF